MTEKQIYLVLEDKFYGNETDDDPLYSYNPVKAFNDLGALQRFVKEECGAVIVNEENNGGIEDECAVYEKVDEEGQLHQYYVEVIGLV